MPVAVGRWVGRISELFAGDVVKEWMSGVTGLGRPRDASGQSKSPVSRRERAGKADGERETKEEKLQISLGGGCRSL